MCVGVVDKKPRRRKGQGYKVVRKLRDNVYLNKFDIVPSTLFVMGEWTVDKRNNRIQERNSVPYLTGFHLLTDKRMALLYCEVGQTVVKVLFNNVTASGIQKDADNSGEMRDFFVVVARKIKLLEEIST